MPLLGVLHERLDPPLQGRQITLHDPPDLAEVHSRIFVDQNVPQAAETAPGNLRGPVTRLWREALRGLADDLQVPDHCILRLWVSHEGVPTVGCVRFYTPHAFQDVNKIEAVVVHSGTASATIRSRMYQ